MLESEAGQRDGYPEYRAQNDRPQSRAPQSGRVNRQPDRRKRNRDQQGRGVTEPVVVRTRNQAGAVRGCEREEPKQESRHQP